MARIRSGDGDTAVWTQIRFGAHVLGGHGRSITKHRVDYIGIIGSHITESYGKLRTSGLFGDES